MAEDFFSQLLERLGYAKPLGRERWELVWPKEDGA